MTSTGALREKRTPLIHLNEASIATQQAYQSEELANNQTQHNATTSGEALHYPIKPRESKHSWQNIF